MTAPVERDQEIETLRRRLGALEAQASGLGLAQVMTREFGGEIRFWSRGMERLYGFTAAEAVGKISHKLLRTEFPLSLHALDRELLEHEAWTGELRHRRRDGSDIVVVSHQSLLRDPGGGVSLVTEANNDITEERRGREARLYLASIVESSDDAIIGKTLDGVVTSWNHAAEVIFGFAGAEMIGRPITLLHPPDRVHEAAMILERLTRGERPILGPGGTIIGASKIVRDITADRSSQVRIAELQAELVHVARLSTMGQMASAIAHELNQPLTAVGNYAGALGRVLSTSNADPERVRDTVERIRRQTTRAGDVIRQLRDHVAKRGATRRQEAVNTVVDEAVELGLVGTRHQSVRTDIRLDATVGSASLDRIQIGQVVINLVPNAVEAMETSEQRELVVATRAADGAVEITVSDTGPGFALEIAPRLFQPFVTTKPTGLGLGLSICREIVEAHEGQLTAAPGDAGGTVFTIRLPVTPDGSDHDLRER